MSVIIIIIIKVKAIKAINALIRLPPELFMQKTSLQIHCRGKIQPFLYHLASNFSVMSNLLAKNDCGTLIIVCINRKHFIERKKLTTNKIRS